MSSILAKYEKDVEKASKALITSTEVDISKFFDYKTEEEVDNEEEPNLSDEDIVEENDQKLAKSNLNGLDTESSFLFRYEAGVRKATTDNITIKGPTSFKGVHGGLSSDYVGNSSEFYSSGSNYQSSDLYTNSDRYLSSDDYISTDSIVELLNKHPAFLKFPKEQNQSIVASIVSLSTICSGVFIMVVSEGTLLSVGMSMIMSGINGFCISIDESFTWGKFTASFLKETITMIAFAAGHVVHGAVGIAMRSYNLISEAVLPVVCNVASSLAGCGARIGSYTVVNYLEGKESSSLQLLWQGMLGAVNGYQAGVYGLNVLETAKKVNWKGASFFASLAKMYQSVNNKWLNHIANNPGRLPHQHIMTFLLPGFEKNVSLLIGRHNGNHRGYGLKHIIEQHLDLFKKLFTEFNGTESKDLPKLKFSWYLKAADLLIKCIGNGTFIRTEDKKLIYQVSDKDNNTRLISITLSNDPWNNASIDNDLQTIVQANLVSD